MVIHCSVTVTINHQNGLEINPKITPIFCNFIVSLVTRRKAVAPNSEIPT
jgi:hypothetical protein